MRIRELYEMLTFPSQDCSNTRELNQGKASALWHLCPNTQWWAVQTTKQTELPHLHFFSWQTNKQQTLQARRSEGRVRKSKQGILLPSSSKKLWWARSLLKVHLPTLFLISQWVKTWFGKRSLPLTLWTISAFVITANFILERDLSKFRQLINCPLLVYAFQRD